MAGVNLYDHNEDGETTDLNQELCYNTTIYALARYSGHKIGFEILQASTELEDIEKEYIDWGIDSLSDDDSIFYLDINEAEKALEELQETIGKNNMTNTFENRLKALNYRERALKEDIIAEMQNFLKERNVQSFTLAEPLRIFGIQDNEEAIGFDYDSIFCQNNFMLDTYSNFLWDYITVDLLSILEEAKIQEIITKEEKIAFLNAINPDINEDTGALIRKEEDVKKVVVQVKSGMAYPVEKTAGVELVIVDLDTDISQEDDIDPDNVTVYEADKIINE